MSQLAVGIIETIGLAACIEAADACVKSANVRLIGYELSKGGGMAVLKVEGDVGAVKAAIDAATVAANKVSRVFSSKVIPRPSDQIDLLIRNKDTVGYLEQKIEVEKIVEVENEVLEYENIDQQIEVIEQEIKIDKNLNCEEKNMGNVNYTCNICKDPKCSREKGDLRTNCIHYNELNDN